MSVDNKLWGLNGCGQIRFHEVCKVEKLEEYTSFTRYRDSSISSETNDWEVL